MQAHERQFLLDELASTHARLLQAIHGLTEPQRHFHETPLRWSTAEIVEHLVAFEHFIRQAITNALSAPAEPHKRPAAPAKESLVLNLAHTRNVPFITREVNKPTGHWTDFSDLLSELEECRALTLNFTAETQAPLRDHFFPHIAFGDLDCYQWLLVISQHTARHIAQINQIKAHPDYPAVAPPPLAS